MIYQKLAMIWIDEKWRYVYVFAEFVGVRKNILKYIFKVID